MFRKIFVTSFFLQVLIYNILSCDIQDRFRCNVNCDGYYICSHGIDEMFSCPQGQHCDMIKHNCSLEVSSCGPEGYQFKCSSEGIYPDPYDCAKYYICGPAPGHDQYDPEPAEDGTDFRHSCTDGFAYNPGSTLCDFNLTDDVCKYGPVPKCEVLYQTDSLRTNESIYYICTKIGNYGLIPQLFRCDSGYYNSTTCKCNNYNLNLERYSVFPCSVNDNQTTTFTSDITENSTDYSTEIFSTTSGSTTEGTASTFYPTEGTTGETTTFPPTEGTASTFYSTEGTTGENTTFPPTEGTASTFYPTEGTTGSSTGETTTFPPTEGTGSTFYPSEGTTGSSTGETTTFPPTEGTGSTFYPTEGTTGETTTFPPTEGTASTFYSTEGTTGETTTFPPTEGTASTFYPTEGTTGSSTGETTTFPPTEGTASTFYPTEGTTGSSTGETTTFPPTEGTGSTFYPTEGTTGSSTGETTTFPPTEGTASTFNPTEGTTGSSTGETTTFPPTEGTASTFYSTEGTTGETTTFPPTEGTASTFYPTEGTTGSSTGETTTFPPTEGTASTFYPTEGTTGETTTFPPTEGTTSTLSPTTTTISATETEITTSEPPESTTLRIICTSPGIFPDPYDCHSYYICNVHLDLFHYTCGEESYFNPSALECQEGDECPALSTQTTGIVPTTEETLTHAPFHCDAPGIYPDCYDCHAFYRCTVTGHMYHEYCPSGSHFDNLYAGCVDGEDCPDVICN